MAPLGEVDRLLTVNCEKSAPKVGACVKLE